jgi:hypothetical protein
LRERDRELVPAEHRRGASEALEALRREGFGQPIDTIIAEAVEALPDSSDNVSVTSSRGVAG